MSFGLTPNFTMDFSFDGLTPAQFLALCANTANALDWDLRYISDSGLIALTEKKLLRRKQEVTIRIYEGYANIRSESTGNEMMDWGKNRKNVQAFTDGFAENKANTTPEQMEQTYEELKERFPAPEQDVLSKPPATTKDKWAGFFGLFIPREGYFITPILVDLNLTVFLLMVLTGANILLPDSHSLISWGANSRYLTLDHQWWRLLTNCFVHIGIFHLLFNMYALLYIGLLLEPQLGKLRFATAYLLTGIMASLTSLFWHSFTLSAGASGAIFGMYGVFLALLTTNLIDKGKRTALLASIGIFVGYNLLYGTKSGVDNAAHVGGLISGILIGYLFYPGLKKPDSPRLAYPAIGIATVLVLTTAIVALNKIPNTFAVYQQKMKAFEGYENSALAFYRLDDTTSKNIQLTALRYSGISDWNKCLRVLDEANELEIPDILKKHTDAMIQYCNVRISSYNYMASKIDGTAGPGEDSVEIYNVQIKDLINSLTSDK
jgi:rhomboid protease GluP